MTDRMEDLELDNESRQEFAHNEPLEREGSIEGPLTGELGQAERLEDATLEPAARVEADGNFIRAEAIEAALTGLVDSSQEAAAEGGKNAFGQEAGDASQHYSGVQMAQGDVQSDQDWNEGANAPSTEEMGGRSDDYSPSAGADDMPREK